MSTHDLRAYYATRAWKQTARKARAYYRWRCAVCGDDWRERGAYLAVHHLHYRTLGREAMKDLRCLCSDHHPRGHFPEASIHSWRRDYGFAKALGWVVFLPLRLLRAAWRAVRGQRRR